MDEEHIVIFPDWHLRSKALGINILPCVIDRQGVETKVGAIDGQTVHVKHKTVILLQIIDHIAIITEIHPLLIAQFELFDCFERREIDQLPIEIEKKRCRHGER